MAYFTQAFIDFFASLDQNNNREWFHENKKHYEKNVKKPFTGFIQDLINEIGKHEPIGATPKDCMFRINRDIRFSKDKTPYKPHASAFIANGGRKDTAAGFFLQFSHQYIHLGGGMYMPTKDQLYKIRQHIQYNLEEFAQCCEDKIFVKCYDSIAGEKNKIVPKEFKEDVQQEPLIANKQFYYIKEYTPKEIPQLLLQDDLLDWVMQHYHAGQTINRFLNEAVAE